MLAYKNVRPVFRKSEPFNLVYFVTRTVMDEVAHYYESVTNFVASKRGPRYLSFPYMALGLIYFSCRLFSVFLLFLLQRMQLLLV